MKKKIKDIMLAVAFVFAMYAALAEPTATQCEDAITALIIVKVLAVIVGGFAVWFASREEEKEEENNNH